MEILKTVLLLIAITAATMAVGILISSVASDVEVIEPDEDIECVVISRMFNTSVDCNWERSDGVHTRRKSQETHQEVDE